MSKLAVLVVAPGIHLVLVGVEVVVNGGGDVLRLKVGYAMFAHNIEVRPRAPRNSGVVADLPNM